MSCRDDANPEDFTRGHGSHGHGHGSSHGHGHGSSHGHGHGSSHGHGHGDGGDCPHSHDQSDKSNAYSGASLLCYIDVPHISCLNEEEDDSCQAVFKPWARRLDFDDQALSSDDDDPQLILKIPFTDLVRIRSFQVVCQDPDKAPSNVKLYKDVDNMDFSSCEDYPVTQEFQLTPDEGADLFYNVKVHKFNNVGSLTMFFDAAFDDAEQVSINFINLQGEYTAAKARPVETIYEASSIATDHKNKAKKDSKNDYIV